MKHILLFGATFLMTLALHAQSQRTIPYQAAARNAQGNPLLNQAIKVRFSLIDSAAVGPLIYQETHNATTNALGIFNLYIGNGTATSGFYDSLVWNSGKRYLKVELNPSGTGNTYIDLGTQPLLAVPYALYAEQSGSYLDMRVSDYGDTLFTGNGKWLIVPGVSGANSSMFTNGYLTDIDGNSYKTVKIGNQTWMAENLKVSRFSDQTPINELNLITPWSGSTYVPLNDFLHTAGYSHYNQSIQNDNTMGKLYNFTVIESTKNVCPTGWHVPTKLDWTLLISHINTVYTGQGIKPLVDQTWSIDTTSNVTGFSLKPSGFMLKNWHDNDGLIYIGYNSSPFYWSKTYIPSPECTGSVNLFNRPQFMMFDLNIFNNGSTTQISYNNYFTDVSIAQNNIGSDITCLGLIYFNLNYEKNPALAMPIRCIKD
jgi:uncharacterized protein (TIGR02145 family)